MKHQVDLQSLINWRKGARMEFASSHGKRQNKQLYCRLDGFYEVWNQAELVLITTLSSHAVKKYNEL